MAGFSIDEFAALSAVLALGLVALGALRAHLYSWTQGMYLALSGCAVAGISAAIVGTILTDGSIGRGRCAVMVFAATELLVVTLMVMPRDSRRVVTLLTPERPWGWWVRAAMAVPAVAALRWVWRDLGWHWFGVVCWAACPFGLAWIATARRSSFTKGTS